MARSDLLLAELHGRPLHDDGPSLVGTALAALAAIGWTMLAVVILTAILVACTAILVACCAPFALTFMFFRKVVGA